MLIGEALGVFTDRIKGLIIRGEGEQGVCSDSCVSDLCNRMVGQVGV